MNKVLSTSLSKNQAKFILGVMHEEEILLHYTIIYTLKPPEIATRVFVLFAFLRY